MFNKQAAIEMAKEAGRLAFFAAITALVAYFGDVLGGMDPNSMVVVFGTLILRLIDRYIHENENTNLSGVAPF